MTTDRRTSIRASQLRNFELTGYDIQNASISGSQKLIDGSVTDAKLTETYIKSGDNISIEAAPGSDQSANGITSTMDVDVNTVGFGAALHMDTDGNWIEAAASGVGTMPCHSIALAAGTGSKEVLLRGFIRDDSWNWAVGNPIYVSTVAGTFTQTIPSVVGDQIQIVGFATNADRMFFSPDYVMGEIS